MCGLQERMRTPGERGKSFEKMLKREILDLMEAGGGWVGRAVVETFRTLEEQKV